MVVITTSVGVKNPAVHEPLPFGGSLGLLEGMVLDLVRIETAHTGQALERGDQAKRVVVVLAAQTLA
jgi:hypothetical protein